MQTRIVEDMPPEVYHAHPSLSFSLLKMLAPENTLRDFWWKSWLNPLRDLEDEIDTAALRFGRAMHMLLLEPDRFDLTYEVDRKVKSSSRTNTIGGADGGDWQKMQRMRDSLMSHQLIAQTLVGCKAEVSMFAEVVVPDPQAPPEQQFAWPVRCRHDIWKPSYSCDLKFVAEVNRRSVAAMIAEYRYDQQAEWYLRIMQACSPTHAHQNFAFIFVEKQPPYKVMAVQVTPDVLATSARRNDAMLGRFKQAMLTMPKVKPWPAFEDRFEQLWLPNTGGEGGICLPQWWDYRE